MLRKLKLKEAMWYWIHLLIGITAANKLSKLIQKRNTLSKQIELSMTFFMEHLILQRQQEMENPHFQ